MAALSDVIVEGLRRRGADELTSTVAAHLGLTVINVALTRWLDEDGQQPLRDRVHDTVMTVGTIAPDLVAQRSPAKPSAPPQVGA